jgi:Stress responsive A/B Barrel Domain
MFRKCMMLLALAITGVILSMTAMNPTQGQVRRDRRVTIRKAAPFVHTVIFYLKKDAPANEADAIIADTQRLLAKIPSVREIRAGRPADKGSAVVVKDYQVGLLVLFDDAEGMQTYLDHPLHKEFVSGHEKGFEKVVVYDFVSKEP